MSDTTQKTPQEPSNSKYLEREKYVKDNLRQARIALLNIQTLVGPLDPRFMEYDEIIGWFEESITGRPAHLG